MVARFSEGTNDMRIYEVTDPASIIECQVCAGRMENTYREHQRRERDAFRAYVAGKNEIGYCSMFCGTGKSIVIRDRLDCNFFLHKLVCFSGITLTHDFLRTYCTVGGAHKYMRYVVVCCTSDSDGAASGDEDDGGEDDEDDENIHTVNDEEYERCVASGRLITTTDVEVIRYALLKSIEDGIPLTILSTYHSACRIAEAFASDETLCKTAFGISMFDEAHNVSLKSSRTSFLLESGFATRHLGVSLYLTATPTDEMAENPDLFGHEYFTYPSGMAIRDGVIRDLSIRCTAIGTNVANPTFADYDSRQRALVRAICTAIVQERRSRVIIFSQYSTKNAGKNKRSFVTSAGDFPILLEEFQDCVRAIDTAGYYDVDNMVVVSVDAKTRARDRRKIFRAMNSAEDNQIFIICNSHILREGVNIPAVNMIVFADPRIREIDVIQNVSRGLRWTEKDLRALLVLLPVFVDADEFQSNRHDPEGRDRVVRTSMQTIGGNFMTMACILEKIRLKGVIADRNMDALMKCIQDTWQTNVVLARFGRLRDIARPEATIDDGAPLWYNAALRTARNFGQEEIAEALELHRNTLALPGVEMADVAAQIGVPVVVVSSDTIENMPARLFNQDTLVIAEGLDGRFDATRPSIRYEAMDGGGDNDSPDLITVVKKMNPNRHFKRIPKATTEQQQQQFVGLHWDVIDPTDAWEQLPLAGDDEMKNVELSLDFVGDGNHHDRDDGENRGNDGGENGDNGDNNGDNGENEDNGDNGDNEDNGDNGENGENDDNDENGDIDTDVVNTNSELGTACNIADSFDDGRNSVSLKPKKSQTIIGNTKEKLAKLFARRQHSRESQKPKKKKTCNPDYLWDDFDADIRETDVDADVRETDVDADVRETDVDADVRETDVDADVRETDVDADVRETNVDADVRETNVDADIRETNVDADVIHASEKSQDMNLVLKEDLEKVIADLLMLLGKCDIPCPDGKVFVFTDILKSVETHSMAARAFLMTQREFEKQIGYLDQKFLLSCLLDKTKHSNPLRIVGDALVLKWLGRIGSDDDVREQIYKNKKLSIISDFGQVAHKCPLLLAAHEYSWKSAKFSEQEPYKLVKSLGERVQGLHEKMGLGVVPIETAEQLDKFMKKFKELCVKFEIHSVKFYGTFGELAEAQKQAQKIAVELKKSLKIAELPSSGKNNKKIIVNPQMWVADDDDDVHGLLARNDCMFCGMPFYDWTAADITYHSAFKCKEIPNKICMDMRLAYYRHPEDMKRRAEKRVGYREEIALKRARDGKNFETWKRTCSREQLEEWQRQAKESLDRYVENIQKK
jgi:superfamily II DNA or RNA helicase